MDQSDRMKQDERSLIERHIEESPYAPGAGDARLRDYGVSVWALVAYHTAAEGDVDRVAADYCVPREAIEAALAYYRAHKAQIDARNEEHFAAVG